MAVALNNILTEGNFNAGRGNFGLSEFATLNATPVDFWTIFPRRPNRAVVDPGAGAKIMRLPDIDSIAFPSPGSPLALNKASIGHNLLIKNESGVFNLELTGAAGTALTTLTPGLSAILIARSGGDDWVIVSTFASTVAAPTDLQEAYNNSLAHPNPEIIVDATNLAVTIRDNAAPIGTNLLEVQDNTAENQLAVGANYITGLGATTSGTDSVAIGPSLTVPSSNTVALSDGSGALTTTGQANRLVTLFSAGELSTQTAVLPGTNLNGGNSLKIHGSGLTTINNTIGTFPQVIPLPNNTSAQFSVKVVGKSTTTNAVWTIKTEHSAVNAVASITSNGTSPVSTSTVIGGASLGLPTLSPSLSNVTFINGGSNASMVVRIEITNAAVGTIYWTYSAKVSYTTRIP